MNIPEVCTNPFDVHASTDITSMIVYGVQTD